MSVGWSDSITNRSHNALLKLEFFNIVVLQPGSEDS